MKFMELLEIVADEPVFETGFLRGGRVSEPGLEAQLSRWCAAGKLLRLRRGLFALAPPYRKVIPHPFLVANRLSPGSYVSGLSALAFANAIPEYVPEVTSCGPARPHVRETPLGRFSFRYVKPALRTGYRLVALVDGHSAFVVRPDTAFLALAHLPARFGGGGQPEDAHGYGIGKPAVRDYIPVDGLVLEFPQRLHGQVTGCRRFHVHAVVGKP